MEIWIRKPPDRAAAKTAQALAEAFTKASGIQAKVVPVFEDFETKLQQQAAQKDLPDIVINDTSQLGSLVEQGLVGEVDRASIDGSQNINDRAWEAAKGPDGKTYAVPFSAQAFALLIRSDWRQKVGLPQPKTMQELDALSAAFTRNDPDGNGAADTYGLLVPGSTKRGYMSWFFSSFLWASGGDFLRQAGENKWAPAIDSPQSVAAVKWLQDQFCGDPVVQPDAITADTDQSAHPAFENGKAGIYLTGPYLMARFDKNLGAGKYEVVPPPAGLGGGQASLAEGENVYLMAGSPNPEGQRKFAAFATSVEGQTIGMAGDTDGNIVRLPVNRTVDMATVRKDKRWAVFQQVYDNHGRYAPAVPNWTPFRQMSAETLNALAADCSAQPQQRLTELAGKFTEELRKQEVLAQ
ncbi:sugar ABC transporter substrate-binding protein [Amycolatopsis suaedae]|uniref:Sugar ABC transporter substrate-binding protein n=1 Tax=Amycolatopsis suaedae TaxID=2510978 RepID=A0A4Q7J9T0_9PSEU|nr:sugar ABC transporter substrate-binding protein [Amycolatopsis suaedae]